MKTYLDQLILDSKMKLQADNRNLSAYKNLVEGTYCSLLLFNKRRVGELERLQLDTYLKHHDKKPSGEFDKLLSPSEKILINSLKRVVIRGKRGRGVPVLFDKVTQEGIDLSLKFRDHFYPSYNPYLFGLCNSDTCISGYHTFRKHVKNGLGDQSKTKSLTSTKLRKHLATISQILKMESGDLEQLATFMGHNIKTHTEWYRLPNDVYQTAKVSKILLLAQNNSIDKYRGQKLDELEVGDEVIETQDDSENEMGEQMENDEVITEEKKLTAPPCVRKKEKIIKRAWTKNEKEVTENFFRNHIRKRIAPKKKEVLQLIEMQPQLKTREWQTIKVYVCNQFNKK